jgi:hypothetical protein
VTVEHVGTPSFGTTPTPPSHEPGLSDLLEVKVHKDTTHHWVEARLPAENRASAALLVATHIARHRCGGAPQYFDAWLARHGGGPPHPPLGAGSGVQPVLANEPGVQAGGQDSPGS